MSVEELNLEKYFNWHPGSRHVDASGVGESPASTETPVNSPQPAEAPESADGLPERVATAKNLVYEGFGLYHDDPETMHTSEKSVYRITGERQIQDIIESGYIRPRPDRPGSTHNGKVYWSHGGEKLFYNGGNPDHYILQAKADLIKNGQIGAPSIDTLEAIWKCLRDVQPGEPWRVDILEEVLAARQAYLQGAAPGETAS